MIFYFLFSHIFPLGFNQPLFGSEIYWKYFFSLLDTSKSIQKRKSRFSSLWTSVLHHVRLPASRESSFAGSALRTHRVCVQGWFGARERRSEWGIATIAFTDACLGLDSSPMYPVGLCICSDNRKFDICLSWAYPNFYFLRSNQLPKCHHLECSRLDERQATGSQLYADCREAEYNSSPRALHGLLGWEYAEGAQGLLVWHVSKMPPWFVPAFLKDQCRGILLTL